LSHSNFPKSTVQKKSWKILIKYGPFPKKRGWKRLGELNLQIEEN